jgi:hypothetical protein
MTGKQLCEAVRNDNAAKVSMLLCTHIAQSFINYQDAHGATLLGSRVVITGLVAKPELTGLTDTAVSVDDDEGPYSVELDDTSSSFMIKPCNLLPTMKEKQDYTPVCSVALCSLLFSHV